MFRTVPILLFIILLLPIQAFAQNNPAYTVNDVKVDIVSESSVIARNKAFSEAQAQAFRMLSRRFMPAEQAASFTPPDAVAIAGMVSDFEITSEQMSKRRYLGTYIFRFKAGPVNRYFGHGPVGNFNDGAATRGKLIVLPYFAQKLPDGMQSSLWDTRKNPWLEAWQNHKSDQAALIVPPGDISDTMDMRETTPDGITRSGVTRMLARYNADDIVAVSAVFDRSAKDMLSVDIYRTDRGRAEKIQTLSVPTAGAKKLGDLLDAAIPQVQTLLGGNWKGEAGSQAYEATAEAASADNAAPSGPASPYTPQAGQINATARFSSISEWLSIRRSLNDLPPLKSVLITSLSTDQAMMQITYSDWMALTSALSARGLSLHPSGAASYTLMKTNRTVYSR